MPYKFRLHNPSTTKTSIFLDVSFRGRRYKKQIGQTIASADWNAKIQRCRITRKNEFASVINDKIDNWSVAIVETLKHFTLSNYAPAPIEFWAKFNTFLSGNNDEITFVKFAYEYCDASAAIRSKSRIDTIKRTIRWIEEIEAKIYRRTLRFEDINIDFYNHLRNTVYGTGLSANTFGSYINVIRAICHEARQRHINECSGIDHKGFTVPEETADTIYLTEDELLKIHNLKLTPNIVHEINRIYGAPESKNIDKEVAIYETVRAKFLIGAFTALRVSDFNSLTSANIRGDYLVVPVKKSGYTRSVTIPIHWVVREIIDKGFDLSVPISDQKINDYIKKICLYVGIDNDIEITRSVGGHRIKTTKKKWQLVSNHTARRSAATNMYKSGIPSLSIMKITGHATEASFLKYIKVSAEENAEILSKHDFFTKK